MLTLAVQGCTLWAERPVRQWNDATGGEGLERNFWREVQAKNWVELERHLAGNYISVESEGWWDRPAALERLRKLQLNEYSLGEFQVELNGSTLVVTYTIAMNGSFNGQPLPSMPLRMMGVWQQHKSGWAAIAHSTLRR